MPKISFFMENLGHETFLEALTQRFEKEYHVSVGDIERGSAHGGHGKAINESRVSGADRRISGKASQGFKT